MQIASIGTGEEFLCIDKGTFQKIIKKLERNFLIKQEDTNIEEIFSENEYIVFDQAFQKIKEIFKKSKNLFDTLKEDLQKELITQIVPDNATGQKYLTLEKLTDHNLKYAVLNYNILLLEIRRHPEKNDNFKRQYRVFDNKKHTIELTFVGDITHICKSTGEMKSYINGTRQEPGFKLNFNNLLKKYFGEVGKKQFRDKINCYNEDLLPEINNNLRTLIGKRYGINKVPQDQIKDIELPYIEKLIRAGKMTGDYGMKVGKGSIESNLFQ